jgi:hypothetical protein
MADPMRPRRRGIRGSHKYPDNLTRASVREAHSGKWFDTHSKPACSPLSRIDPASGSFSSKNASWDLAAERIAPPAFRIACDGAISTEPLHIPVTGRSRRFAKFAAVLVGPCRTCAYRPRILSRPRIVLRTFSGRIIGRLKSGEEGSKSLAAAAAGIGVATKA